MGWVWFCWGLRAKSPAALPNAYRLTAVDAVLPYGATIVAGWWGHGGRMVGPRRPDGGLGGDDDHWAGVWAIARRRAAVAELADGVPSPAEQDVAVSART